MTIPGRGESVGEAYIRIHADGSGLPREIRDEYNRANPSIEAAGRDQHAAYQKGFDEEQQKHKDDTTRKLLEDFRRGRGQWDATGRLLGGDLAKGVKRGLERDLGKDIGSRIFRNLSDEAERAGSFDVFTRGLQRVGPRIAQAVRQIQAEERKIVERDHATALQQERDADNASKRLEQILKDRYDKLLKLNEGFALRDRDIHRRRIADAVNQIRREGGNLRDLENDLTSFNHRVDQGFVRMSNGIRGGTRDVSSFERHLIRINDRVSHFDLGKAFGKGSRNNFFNAIGSVVGAAAEAVVSGSLRMVRSIAGVSHELFVAVHDAESFGQGMKNVGNILGGVALKGIKGFVGAIGGGFVALNLFAAVAGPLAALISMLAGSVVALASTIGFGLVGAVGAALPILGVMGAAVAVLAVAFTGMNKAQRDLLKVRLAPLVKDFNQLRNATREGLFSGLKQQVPLLQRVLNSQIQPLFVSTARAMSHSLTGFLTMLNGPAFRKNFESMRTFFPQAIEKLGKVGTNAFLGISNVLRALVPLASHVLDVMVKSSDTFAKWSSTAGGQNRIALFFNRAFESAQKLWAFTKALGTVIGDLLSAGRGTGNSLFDSMTSSLQRFDRYMRSSSGRVAVQGFFQDVRRFATALGSFFGGVGKLFGALDTGQTRATLNSILRVVGAAASLLADTLPAIFAFQHVFFQTLGGLAKPLVGLFKALEPLIKSVAGLIAGGLTVAAKVLVVALTPIINALAAIARFMSAHENIFGPLIASLIALRLVSGTLTFLSLLPGRIGAAGTAISGAVSRQAAAVRASGLNLKRSIAGIGVILGAQALGDKIGGKGGLATSILGSAAGGALIGSSFGPLGAAIGGLAGGVLGIGKAWLDSGKKAQAANAQAKAAAEAQKAAVLDLAAAIEGAGGASFAPIKTDAIQSLQKSGALAIADKLGFSLKNLTAAALGNNTQMQAWSTTLLNAAGSGKITSKQYQELSNELLQIQFKGADAEKVFEQTSAAAGKLGFAMIPLRTETAKYGTSLETTTAFGMRNNFVLNTQAKALQATAVAHATSAAAAGAAANKYLAGVDALRRQAVAAGFNAKAVDRLLAGYRQLPKSIVTKLTKTGVTPTQVNQITAAYHRIPPKWLTSVTKKGVTPAEISRITAAYLRIPKAWRTAVTKSGVTTAQIQAITDRYHRIPRGWLTSVTKRGVTPGQIQAITNTYLRIPTSRHTSLSASADVSSARATIDNFIYSQDGRTITLAVTGKKLMAAGGILRTATEIQRGVWAGEAGWEAVVPLNRPLSQVDASVRALSAIAQGLASPGSQKMATGGTVAGGGKTINVYPGAFQIITPTTDPMAVATEMFNRLTTGGYS